jgi:hypothetical protein
VVRQELVDRVDEAGQPQSAQDATDGTGQIELEEQEDAASSVSRHGRPVPEHEPPALAAACWWNGGEHVIGVSHLQRQQR